MSFNGPSRQPWNLELQQIRNQADNASMDTFHLLVPVTVEHLQFPDVWARVVCYQEGGLGVGKRVNMTVWT